MGEVIKVGMADLKTAKAPNTLTTLGLGSCIGLTLYDPVTKIGGLVHYMLPDSTKLKNNTNIAKFGDTGIRELLRQVLALAKISNLSQGTFVGSVSDNFGEKIDQKIFHAEIIVDHAKVSAEEKAYKKIPVINRFKDSEGNDIMLQQIQRNYDQIKADAQAIINDEMERIKSDPELCERLGIESAEEEKRKAE